MQSFIAAPVAVIERRRSSHRTWIGEQKHRSLNTGDVVQKKPARGEANANGGSKKQRWIASSFTNPAS